ncbi:MAG: hypothetical protein GX605_12405 [Chloroflexi bacterium]|nr:hypothetical protein [Chloroflexota bacterium]
MPPTTPGAERTVQTISLTLAASLLGAALSPLMAAWLLASGRTGAEWLAWLPALLTASLAGLGAAVVADERRSTLGLPWPAPALAAGLATYALALAPTRLYWLLGLVGLGAMLALFLLLASEPGPMPEGRQNALLAGLYLLGWLAMSLTHDLGPWAPAAALVAAALLGAQALSATEPDTPPWAACLALGLVAAGAAWVMHLLPTSRWVAGTVQLLLFHAGLSLRAHPDSRAAVLWAGLPLAAALAALGIA